MKVLDKSRKPYTPSWAMNSDHLKRKFQQIRKQLKEDERKAEEELFQQNQHNIYSWK